ncbi:MAG: DUF4421 domain-containing protein [Bacteroidaceae bacterium]|nr:DUF4421 domain-containing protein [Bacteroidaceae bacterium]
MLFRKFFILSLMLLQLADAAAEDGLSMDSIQQEESFYVPRIIDFRNVHRDTTLTKLQKLSAYGNIFVRFIDEFDRIDQSYVERNHYNFTAMLQGTSNYEFYWLSNRQLDYSLGFAQHPDYRVGPYFGWKWLFLGYTFDVSNYSGSRRQTSRFEFSIYTSMIGVDLIWRRTGSDFYLRRISGLGDDATKFEGTDTRYINSSMQALNMYYIFNHRRFSNPAVYSQSTIQRRSAGSWQVGASIATQDIYFDYTLLPTELFASTSNISQLSTLERIKYTDYSVNFGYAYNFVFRRDWCLGISVLPALSYKWFSTQTVVVQNDAEQELSVSRFEKFFRQRGDINIGGTARAGLIFNNGRWFAGAFAVLHDYNYKRSDIHFSNFFGTINACVGVYFQRKRVNVVDGKPVRGGGLRLGL